MELYPLVILAVGIAIVITLILGLRINAFIALITAAIVISLMAPGAWGEKITRVAVAFGNVAGAIGIVIALAAVIGRALMDSGAAQRIVQALLRLLGEERTPVALMGSGFVLSVPVFFDTVFYLLIPLARSLWTKTRRHYVLYITAMVAGGAVTHALVPPTPGPLFMANELGIDLGLMILVGAMIGLPVSIVGLYVCHRLDRWLHLPMRPYAGAEEAAMAEEADVAVAETHAAAGSAQTPAFDTPAPDAPAPDAPTQQLPPLWLSLAPVVLPVLLISANTFAVALGGPEVAADSAWASVQAFTAVAGDPNLALLLSAVIALLTLVLWKRRPLARLADDVEEALMSGGLIILITAAGGAFGGMLRAAGIQDAMQYLVGDVSTISGMAVLLTAFGVASLIKFAQGSSTVAMITTSSMFAAMGFTATSLGFHPVYLATVIGSGAMVGDWMNNSGFWIFSKMSVLTTEETLKSWSILLAALGFTGLIVTLLAAMLIPLV